MIHEHLTHSDQEKQDKVEDDHDGEGEHEPREAISGHEGEWDADIGLAEEAPVVVVRQERVDGQKHAQDPGHTASQQGRTTTEVDAATEREAENEEAVQSYETDGEGRHFTGQETEETRDAAGRTLFPGLVVKDELPAVENIHRAQHEQVETHEEVPQTQTGDEHAKAGLYGTLDEPGEQTAHVAHHRQHTEQPQRGAVGVVLKQVLARVQWSVHSVAVAGVESLR